MYHCIVLSTHPEVLMWWWWCRRRRAKFILLCLELPID